ncbi:MAG: Pyruvate kinase [Verrucomicrobiota bacterium]
MNQTAYRHTKIIFTIGPATNQPDILRQLLSADVDVCRLNMAHADHEWTGQAIARVREAGQAVGRKVAIMMDIKGPEIRTGPLEQPFFLERDEVFDFFTTPNAEPSTGSPKGVRVNYPELSEDVKVGDTILVDSGLLRLRVMEMLPDRIRCLVRIGGELGSRRHINLPGVHVRLPALTAKDYEDIKIGIANGIDFFALSFVRSPDDLDILRRTIRDMGSKAQIIAKIEDQSAISNLDDIVKASDGLMVARGDLGIEIPFETLPLVQRRAVRTCQRMGKPVIVATHMLESMISNPLPTRAEVTDISNAVFEQADCIMLSGETTVGKYPVECVEVMTRIIRSIEAQADRKLNEELPLKTPKELMLKSAVMLSDSIRNGGIVVFTRSGYLARMLSALRPTRSPIFAFTDVPEVFQNLLIYWGVEPFEMTFSEDPEETIQNAFARLKARGWAEPRDNMVVVSNILAGNKIIDTIQLRSIP